ncbi:MAG: sigma 54-interacting transcriptional regulator, partial [Candidatus Riflebacteria bacterium]|nr:sigma 54-interacting transcriptional regulator [Candidatus Riflebacteria bacterium]
QIRFSSGILSNEKLINHVLSVDDRPDIKIALQNGEVSLIKDTINPDHHDTYEGLVELPTGHSCMLTPLKAGGEVIGMMTLDHRQCDLFTPERVKIAGILSQLLAIALAQSLQTEKLLSEKTTLLCERNALMHDMARVAGSLVGNSPRWVQVLQKIRLVAPTDSHVMILGETGTGKEQVAKAVHALSARSGKPFITLNCSALNHNLAESELFGHEKGAFTGAVALRKGRFELADGGTLFLDELGDLPPETQPKLLRAIQEGTFERLGSEKTIMSNVRIISATNARLEEKVRKGQFREDLYYRLNVFPISLPPLRERLSDVVLLAQHFVERLSARFSYQKVDISVAAMRVLLENSWPGNVRELQNTIERALINCRGSQIRPQHIIFESQAAPANTSENSGSSEIADFDSEVARIIRRALQLTNGRIYGENGAAHLLKLKPTTLQSKMKKLGLRNA